MSTLKYSFLLFAFTAVSAFGLAYLSPDSQASLEPDEEAIKAYQTQNIEGEYFSEPMSRITDNAKKVLIQVEFGKAAADPIRLRICSLFRLQGKRHCLNGAQGTLAYDEDFEGFKGHLNGLKPSILLRVSKSSKDELLITFNSKKYHATRVSNGLDSEGLVY